MTVADEIAELRGRCQALEVMVDRLSLDDDDRAALRSLQTLARAALQAIDKRSVGVAETLAAMPDDLANLYLREIERVVKALDLVERLISTDDVPTRS